MKQKLDIGLSSILQYVFDSLMSGNDIIVIKTLRLKINSVDLGI